MNPTTSSAASPEPAVNPWLIAATAMLATFMEVLDTSVANVALPHIAGNLSSSVDEATWVLTAYLVANAIVLPLSGWFSSVFGRKNFYMACVAIFTFASLMCGVAPSLGALVFFRILQGLGGGALAPISQAIVAESFPEEKQGMAMAFFGMGVVVAPVIGPTLGGWITDNYSWRWIFLINIPVGALSVLLTTLLITDPPHLVRRAWAGLRFDYVGIGLISLGLASLEILLDEGQRNDWFGSHMIVAAAVFTVVGLVGAVVWELRHPDPVVDFRILKSGNFALSAVLMYALGFALYGSTAILPIFLQTILGYTATLSGLVLSPGGIAMMVGMAVVGRLMGKIDSRWLVIFGVLVAAYGLIGMSHFNLSVDFETAMWTRTVQALGMAFLFVPINTTAFGSVAKEKLGNASGLMNLFRNIGGSAGIAMVTTIVARRSQFHQDRLVSHLTPLDPNYTQTLQQVTGQLAAQGAGTVDAAAQAHGVLYGLVQRSAAMMAVADTFWTLAVIFLAMIPLALLMRNTGRPGGPIMME